MPPDVEQELRDHAVMADYEARPHYQRNDYLGWIARAKRPETRAKRIQQMVDELRVGGLYMKMDHAPSRKD
ncbi:MAG: YdeI/OmpD-associated family protein [Acidimicrobiales bacterium]|nr:YdeI/OmpD-associated family protein [Acidimicrobiales bacterium]